MNPFETQWEEDTPSTPYPQLTYPTSLPHDVACAMTPEELEALRRRYEFDEEAWDYVLNRPDFKREYTDWRQRLISEGNSFKLKLRAMSEEFLPTLHQLLHSELTAPSVKVDAFKYVVKCSGLEPTKEEDGKNSGQRITINIAPYAAAPTFTPQTIDITPRGE